MHGHLLINLCERRLINVIRAPAENFPDADWDVVGPNVFYSFHQFPDHNNRFFKST